MKKLTILLSILFLTSTAWAFEPTSIPNQFPGVGRSIRPLGMGNAYLTTKGDDETQFFYNPSSINDQEKFKIGFFNPAFSLTTSTIGLIKDIKDLSDDLSGATDAQQTNTFDTFFDTHVGEYHGLNLWMPLLTVRHRWFVANVITDSRTTISFKNRAFPNFEVLSQNTAGVAGGTAYNFLDETLQVGVGVKILYRAVFSEILTTSDAIGDSFGDTFKFSNWRKGYGVGADLGAKYHVPDFGKKSLEFLKPVVGATYQDIGNTRFSGGAPSIPQSLSAGASINPEFGFCDISVLADFREINRKQDLLMKTHFGTEARFGKNWKWFKPSLRAGLNQGYPAVGAGLKLFFFRWNVAYFGEEVGTTTRQKGSYRLATSLNFDI